MTITASPTALLIPGYGFSAKPSVRALQSDRIRVRLAGRVYDIAVIDIDGVNDTTYTGEQTAAEVVEDIYDGLSVPASSPYTLTIQYRSIGTVPVQTLGQWNTQLGGNYTAVQVVGDTVVLTGGSNVTIPEAAFLNDGAIRNMTDDGSVVELAMSCFAGSEIRTSTMSGLRRIKAFCFIDCLHFTTGDWQALEELGDTVAADGVFDNMTGQTITLTVPAALATCNGGNPDGDLQDVQILNTVTINYV